MIVHDSNLRNRIWSERGLANDAWFIMIGNIFLPSISSIVNISYFLRLYKRRSIRKNPQTSNLTQKEANYYFEGHPFDIAHKYANMLKSVMISIFFMPIIPMSLVFGVFGVLFVYLTEKLLLYKRYAAPDATGPILTFGMYQFFDVVLIVFGVRK